MIWINIIIVAYGSISIIIVVLTTIYICPQVTPKEWVFDYVSEVLHIDELIIWVLFKN